MNKLQLLTAAVILLLLLNIGTLVFLFLSNDRRPAPPGPEGNAGDFIIKSLQLDEQQCRQFDTLRIQHHEMVQRAQDEDRRLHDAYFSLLKSPQSNRQSADSIMALMAQQRKTMDSATFEHFRQLRALCRPEQQGKFDRTIDEIARLLGPRPGPPPPGH